MKACLFDLDGVLVDTAKYHYAAWKRLASGLGFCFSESDNERMKGVSRMNSLEILLEVGGFSNLSMEEKWAFATKKNSWYVEYVSQMTPNELLPGVLDFLHEVKAADVKIALVSSSKNSAIVLQRTGISALFDAIIDGNKITHAKPHPEVFLLGAEETGVQPSECVVFEDAAVGIEAAINAGMKSVGVGRPDTLYRSNIVIPNFLNTTWDMIQEKLCAN